MRLRNFINELNSEYGKGITFIDLDGTLFYTFAKIYVLRNGIIIKKLNNQEYNTYELKDGESFDFHEFRSAEMFNKTSIPIPQTVKRINRMMKNINIRGSKIVFLTARADFDNKEIFLDTFRKHGIDMSNIYVERAGNEKGTVASTKKRIVMRYLQTGEFRRVRLLDDSLENLKTFLTIEKDIPQAVLNKVKKIYGIIKPESIKPINFYGLLIQPNGSLKRIK